MRRKPPGAEREALRQESLQASEKAVRLDPTNSEALAYRSLLLDRGDLMGREALFKRSLKARPLACGCEHHFYGSFLWDVGRVKEAVAEFRRSTDVLALNAGSQIALGEALLATGDPARAKEHFDLALDLTSRPHLPAELAVLTAPLSGDYSQAVRILRDPQLLPMPAELRLKALAANQALLSGDAQAKAAAAAGLATLPAGYNGRLVVTLLGALGANSEALRRLEAAAADKPNARSWLFHPSLAAARADPGFPAAAKRLRLIDYWRTSKTRLLLSHRRAPRLQDDLMGVRAAAAYGSQHWMHYDWEVRSADSWLSWACPWSH